MSFARVKTANPQSGCPDAPEVKTATETTVAEKEDAIEFRLKRYPLECEDPKIGFVGSKATVYTGEFKHSLETLHRRW